MVGMYHKKIFSNFFCSPLFPSFLNICESYLNLYFKIHIQRINVFDLFKKNLHVVCDFKSYLLFSLKINFI